MVQKVQAPKNGRNPRWRKKVVANEAWWLGFYGESFTTNIYNKTLDLWKQVKMDYMRRFNYIVYSK